MPKSPFTNVQGANSLFRQVHDDVLQRITAGVYAPGDRIPSISELCASHKVSAITVRRALSDLVAAGLLRGAQGRGMFVVDQHQAKASSSGMLGLVIPESTDSSRFLAGIRRGVEAGAGRASSLLVGISDMDPWREVELLADMIRHRVAGVLVVAATGDRPAGADVRLQALIAGGPPLVFVDRRPPGIEADWISSDNELAGRSAGEALLAQGHRRIAFVWAHECVTVAARRRGLETAMAKDGLALDPQLARGGWDPARDYEGCGYLRTLELFHLPQPPTAIFTSNDGIAWGALRALRFLGRQVPEDVSIIGVDDLPLSATTVPPLSSVRQDTESMGLLAIEQLRRRIAGDSGPVQVRYIPTELVTRRSVAPPRA